MGCGHSKDVTVDTIASKSSKSGTTCTGIKEQNHPHDNEAEHKEINEVPEKKPMSEIVKETPYMTIDEHARKAPESLKNSADDLVNYISTVSKDPKILVRGFFVWISENIKYDVDRFFGTGRKAPYDSFGVMKTGKAVCEGYANVMEDLCRKANIPVKKISGFAKGYGHSADQAFTETSKTDHAWNAVQLEDKWYLLDSTWGSGNVSEASKQFNKCFNEFYFLTPPEHFINNHFPYMDNNMDESTKWQLLEKTVSLFEFSRRGKYYPSAFAMGAKAVSHTDGMVEMENTLTMIFKSEGREEIKFTARLSINAKNGLHKQDNATFGYLENGEFKLFIHPRKVGTYELLVFGRPVQDEGSSACLMEYMVQCTEVKDSEFAYPTAYSENVILQEPLMRKLPANKDIFFKFEAPDLQTVMAGKSHTYFEKSGNTFSGIVNTGNPGRLNVYGGRGGKYDRMKGILEYTIV